MSFRVVIPARLGSTRLPRKVLLEVAGKPVVRHVWEAARQGGAAEVIIATDSAEVMDACKAFGADVRMTAAHHQSGTDRINEVAQAARWADDGIVVNVQGDEPLMPPGLIRQCADLLAGDPAAHIATLCHPLHRVEDWLNPNIVKLVRDHQDYALYFSRAPIPWKRDGRAGGTVSSRSEAAADAGTDGPSRTPLASLGHLVGAAPQLPAGLAFRHIGLYAYRVGALRQFSALPAAELESCEALEQLRALAAGLRIKVGVTHNPPPRGVDTEADLQAVIELMSAS